jgi:hypothetical protein
MNNEHICDPKNPDCAAYLFYLEPENLRPAGSSRRRSITGRQRNIKGVNVKPTLGRIVIYRSRTGNYDVPAIVAATRESLYVQNVEAGYIPPIADEMNVHLIVFSAGLPGNRVTSTDFQVESPYGRAENVGGTYQEFDISFDPESGPGTWRWPERV